MTLLSIIRDVADETGAVARPSTVITNTDTAVAKMLRMANRVGADLAARGTWSALRSERAFTALAADTQTGILPSDFDRFVPETFWDRSNLRLITGPVPPVEWQSLRATVPSAWKRYFTLRGGAVLIYPQMTGGESLAFEYSSRSFCQSALGVAQTAWAADTDTGRISEELITLGTVAYYLRGEGQPWESQMGEYERLFARLLDNDWPDSGVLAVADIFGERRHFDGTPAPDGGGAVIQTDDMSGGGLG